MLRRHAISTWHIIDDKMIKTDSKMEANIITRLSFGFSRYTPDVELSILSGTESRRALVEFKAFSATEFTTNDRRRMLAAAKFYYSAIPLLYIEKTKQWYFIDKDTCLTMIDQPEPGLLGIDQLPSPLVWLPTFNRYGRIYHSTPANLVMRKIADGLDFSVKAFFRPRKNRQRRMK